MMRMQGRVWPIGHLFHCHKRLSFMCGNETLDLPKEKTYHFAGVEVVVKAAQADNAGQWSLIEYAAPAKFAGPAPHYHKAMEEGFYVLNGTVSFAINGQRIEAGPGAFVKVPPLTVHTFCNNTGQPFRMLVLMSPGGFEKYFEELQLLMQEEGTWPPKDTRKITQLLTQYDTFSPSG